MASLRRQTDRTRIPMAADELPDPDNTFSWKNTATYTGYPLKSTYAVVPKYVNKPSENWATAPTDKGFDMKYLETLPVKNTDKVAMQQFDRYILKKYNSLFTTPADRMRAIANTTPSNPNDMAYQKLGNRNYIRGPTSMSIGKY